jgi:flavin reductase (DIM6/NTAB) family NADH-FMN oxidoreductase RutF
MNETDPQKRLAAALGRIPSGLFILTARQGQSETGMLVSWVQQCSFAPPMLSLALQRNRDILTWLPAGASFVVNILDSTETDMIVHFGRGFPLDQPAFEGLDVSRADSGVPVLGDALAFLDCRVEGRCTAGDHELILAQVVGGRLLDEGQPMVHVRKSGMHY